MLVVSQAGRPIVTSLMKRRATKIRDAGDDIQPLVRVLVFSPIADEHAPHSKALSSQFISLISNLYSNLYSNLVNY